MKNNTILPPVYFKSVGINNYKCFKNSNKLDFSNSNKGPAKWTVILGNNGTGKTTILQVIANFQPIDEVFSKSEPLEMLPKGIHSNLASGFKGSEFYGNFYYGDNLTSQQSNYNETASFFGQGIATITPKSEIGGLKIYAYGATRRIGKGSLSNKANNDTQLSLFQDAELINAEEWLMQADYASKKENTLGAKEKLEKIKKVLIDILPDVKGFEFKTSNNLNNYVEFETDYGKVRLNELSYGYQTMIAWVVDFAKNLFENYPNSDDPLSEPAVVLIDEIDLHLHPSWQHSVVSYLDRHFPNTQFIVTSHSPLVVQSADRINLILLQKNKKSKGVSITNHVNVTYKGWTVEEILNELMGLEKTVSDKYLQLMSEFEKAVDLEDNETAQKIYNEFDKILHPENDMRKLLRLQLSKV